MRPGAIPFVQDFKRFQQSTLDFLNDDSSGTFAGISKYGQICWIAKGPRLEVLYLSTLNRRVAWEFGRVVGDQNTTITCVEELPTKDERCLKLLIGISNSSPNGMLCLFDVNTQTIEKTIEIPHPVTALEIVSMYTGDSIPRWALSEQLRYFCGIVAVGCSSGQCFLIDLRIDDKQILSSEIEPCKVQLISPRNRDVENQRLQCLMKGLHLCIPVNESLFTRNGFEYQKPDGVVMKTFRTDHVTVTCLTYIPQTGILAIGYSFGCYQLWKLQVPILEYSSRLESDPMPVTHIAHQEPENDPKNFCYLWVSRSQLDPEEEYANSIATISLYQLSFGHKTFYSGYGVFYDELNSICLRLDHELTSHPVQYGSNYNGTSRTLACYTLVNPRYQPPTRLSDDSFEESNHGPDLSLCLFLWETTEGNKMTRHLALFDINRWYHAQMPATVRYVSSTIDTCSYMCFYGLSDEKLAIGENLLNVYVDTTRMMRFHSNSTLPPEQHFYPSSLEFVTRLIFDSGTVKARFLGDQGQVLNTLRTKGPAVLLHPQELYNLSVYLGLLARPIELVTTNMNTGYQRESLLSLALDYAILTPFKMCISEWANGEYLHQGCSLKFLLDWCWQRVSTIKHQIDTTCVNLYNWSGLFLDERGSKTLYQCERKLSHLVSIFKLFTSQTVPITEQGEFEIQSKVFVTSMLAQHLSVVLWFVDVGLLPENDDTEKMTGNRYAYPIISLMSAYKARRNELQKLNSDTDLLMIDGLVGSCEGVTDLWDREGGTGDYPPPSFHALLSTFLLENIDTQTKHCLSLYLLLDLVSMEAAEDPITISDKIVGYTSRYSLPASLVKKVQAFWLLDHKDFEEAMVLLESQNLTAEFSHWQHRCIVKALFCHGEVKLAQRYLYLANPPMFSMDDIKLKLTVLLANGFVKEALDYQRKTSTKTNMKDLLTHVFYGCQQTKTVDRLLGHLGGDEEKMLEEYLESCDPLSMDILVMYYLQSSRIVEAFQLNEKLKQYTLTEASSKARERAAARNAIVDKYVTIYPAIQRKLLFEQAHVPKRNTHWKSVVKRPTPLSTNVTKSKASVMTQSTYMMKIMEKISEIEAQEQSPEKTLNQSVGAFLCTPVIPSRKSFVQSPTTVQLDTEYDIEDSMFVPFKKSLMDTPSGSSKRGSRYFSACCLTLLETPKVKKVTPEKQRRSTTSMVTPQSILKVRNLVNITSPSPHSGGNTPSSQESGTSGKTSRRLGYSSQSGTPRSMAKCDPGLTGLPRHLMMEVQTASQPTTPKSVSFVEPATPTDTPPTRSPLEPNTSQIATPKSVSFSERSMMSVTQLQPLVTPKRAEKSSIQKSPPPARRRSPRSMTPPDSPRSVKDRSPTPESSQHSPKFAPELDQLCRRSIHDHSPTSGADEENLVLKMEESDENISDEDVEMEEAASSPKAATPTSNLDSSVTSTVSAESVIQVTLRTSPKIAQIADADKVTDEDVSESAVNSSVKMASEPTNNETDSSVHKIESGEPEDQIEMEIEEDGVQVSEVKEIFSENEELPPEPAGETEDKMDVVTSSSNDAVNDEPVSVKQEVEEEFYEPPVVLRVLTPPAEHTPQISPEKVKVRDSPPTLLDTPGSAANLASDTFQHDFIKMVDSVFGESPVLEEDKEKPVPGRSGVQKRKSTVRGKFKLDVTDEMISSNPVKTEDETKVEPMERLTPTRSLRQKKETESSAVLESKEPVTPTRSSRRVKKDGPVTPTRRTPPRGKSKKEEEEMVVISAESPKPFSQKAKEAIQESLLSISHEMKSHNEASPTEMTKIREKSDVTESPSRTPTRSSRRNKAQSDEIQEPETSTPSRSTRKTKKVTETDTGESEKPVTPTRGRRKTVDTLNETKSPARQTRSPGRNKNTNNSEKVHTPTRRQRKKEENLTMVAESDIRDSDDSKKASEDLAAEAMITAQSDIDIGHSDIPVDTAEPGTPSRRASIGRSCKVVAPEQPALPSGRDSIGKSEIPVDFVEQEDLSKSPSRRKSLSRSSKDMAELAILSLTPTRRRSLGRSTKKTESELSPERALTPTRRTSLGRSTKKTESELSPERALTPTRRTSLGRSTKKTESELSPERALTPTRRIGRSTKKTMEITEQTETKMTTEITEQTETKKTPTRRGRPKKVEQSDGEKDTKDQEPKTPTRGRGRGRKLDTADTEDMVVEKSKSKSPVSEAPTRRKRVKKDNDDGDSPSRHTRGQDATGIYDIQSSSFQFSNPMEVDNLEASQGPKAFTPVKSFLFSPPIQQRQSRLESADDKDSKKTQEPETEQAEAEPKETKRTTRKTRMKKLYKEEVFLISPLAKEGSDSGEEGLSVVTRAGNKKVDKKKDTTKTAVQNIVSNIGRRSKRTTYRIGPLGQKK